MYIVSRSSLSLMGTGQMFGASMGFLDTNSSCLPKTRGDFSEGTIQCGFWSCMLIGTASTVLISAQCGMLINQNNGTTYLHVEAKGDFTD